MSIIVIAIVPPFEWTKIWILEFLSKIDVVDDQIMNPIYRQHQ